MKPNIKLPDSLLWNTKARKGFVFRGYETYAHELCRIFGIHRTTFSHRMESGWALEAALVAEPEGGWCVANAHILAEHPDVQLYCQTMMDNYFAEKNKVKRVKVVFEPGRYMKLPSKIEEFTNERT